MRFMAAVPSMSKSLSWLPKGRRDGRSRLVHMVRTESTVASGLMVLVERSISDSEISVPVIIGPALRPAPRQPEAGAVLASRGVAKGIEGLKAGDLLGIGIDGAHFFDGEDFHRVGPPHIRGDRIFVLAQVELDGFGDLRKEVDHRRASQAKGLLGKLQLQPLDASVPFDIREQKDDFDRILEAGRSLRSPNRQRSMKKNFSGKAKYSISRRWPAKVDG